MELIMGIFSIFWSLFASIAVFTNIKKECITPFVKKNYPKKEKEKTIKYCMTYWLIIISVHLIVFGIVLAKFGFGSTSIMGAVSICFMMEALMYAVVYGSIGEFNDMHSRNIEKKETGNHIELSSIKFEEFGIKDIKGFKEILLTCFNKFLQEYSDTNEINLLKVCSEDFYSDAIKSIRKLGAVGHKKILQNLQLVNFCVVGLETKGKYVQAKVYVKFIGKVSIVAKNDTNYQQNNDFQHGEVNECEILFVKDNTIKNSETLINCENCGAPIKNGENVCNYCGSKFINPKNYWKIHEIKKLN